MGYTPASLALEGLTVIDMTHARAGPVCVRQLADWGANVVRIERPGNPEDFSARHEADFQNKHRNKRGMALNLRSDEGRAILYRMIEQTDVLVENFRPDVKTRLKFDYETLRSRNPRLIYASISAFGQDGPYQDRPGVDQVVQGMSGLMSVTGEPGRGPMRVGIPISDIVTGLYSALGILTALVERQKSGQGQWVQASLLESQTFMLDLQAARYLVDGVVPSGVDPSTAAADIPQHDPRRRAGSKMLIDATHPEETRVVVIRGNRVEEFDFETAQRKQLRGNIYLAKVTRVEPSLQAAFIEYGGNRHGFLAFSEIHPDYYRIPVADREALMRETQAALEEMIATEAQTAALDIAEIHALRGESEAALGWLERSVLQRDGGLGIGLQTDPFLRSLRSRPRFLALLQKMNLPAPAEQPAPPK